MSDIKGGSGQYNSQTKNPDGPLTYMTAEAEKENIRRQNLEQLARSMFAPPVAAQYARDKKISPKEMEYRTQAQPPATAWSSGQMSGSYAVKDKYMDSGTGHNPPIEPCTLASFHERP